MNRLEERLINWSFRKHPRFWERWWQRMVGPEVDLRSEALERTGEHTD